MTHTATDSLQYHSFQLSACGAHGLALPLEQADFPRRYALLEVEQYQPVCGVTLKELRRHKSYPEIVPHHRKYQIRCGCLDIRRERTAILPEPLGIYLVRLGLLEQRYHRILRKLRQADLPPCKLRERRSAHRYLPYLAYLL